MEEVKSLSVETLNEARKDLRYPSPYNKVYAPLGAVAASRRCFCWLLKNGYSLMTPLYIHAFCALMETRISNCF